MCLVSDLYQRIIFDCNFRFYLLNISVYTKNMVKIIRNYDFKAKDFFAFLSKELTNEIKKARNNNLKVKIAAGTRYTLKGKDGVTTTNVIIDKFEPNQVYAATFHTLDQSVSVSYTVTDLDKGCQITLAEDIISYDSTKHNKIANLFYDFIYHRSAQEELNKLAAGVDKYLEQQK